MSTSEATQMQYKHWNMILLMATEGVEPLFTCDALQRPQSQRYVSIQV